MADDIFDQIASSYLGKASQKPLPSTSMPNSDVSGLLERLRGGIFSQESSSNYNSASNARTGATGGFQVIPENIPSWTAKHYGQSLTPQQFKQNPKAQEAVFTGEMGSYLKKARRLTSDDDTALRMGAAAWYGGLGAMHRYDDPTKFRPNEPSFREYTSKVLRKSGINPYDEIASNYLASQQTDPFDEIASNYLADTHGGTPVSPTTATPVGNLPPITATPVTQAAQQVATAVTPPVTETPETLNEQLLSVQRDDSPKAAVLYTDPSTVPTGMLTGNLKRFATPEGGVMLVNEAKAKKLGITDYVKDQAKLLNYATDVGNDTGNNQPVVLTTKGGVEVSSAVTPTPAIAKKQARLDRKAHPGSQSVVTTSDEVVAKRLAAQQPPLTPEELALAQQDAQAQNEQFARETPQDYQQLQTQTPQRKISEVSADDADNAIAFEITPPANLNKDDANAYVRNQIAAQYGVDPATLSNGGFYQGYHPGNTIQLTYGDLKSVGIDVNPQIQQKVAEHRIENPTADLSLPDAQKDETVFQKIKGLTPEEAIQENKTDDPLYQQALRNAPDDVEAEYLRLESNQKLERNHAREQGMQLFGSDFLGAGISKALGNFENTGAGLLHYINKIPNIKLFGDEKDPTFLQSAEEQLRRLGGIRESEAQGYSERNPNQGLLRNTVMDAMGLVGDLPYFAALPGHGILAMGGKFAVAGLLKDVGKKGYADTESVQHAGSGFISGVLLAGGGLLGQKARQGLLEGLLPSTIVKELAEGTISLNAKSNIVLHLYERGVTLGSITGATAGQTLLEGGTPEQAFDAATNMALIDMAFHLKTDAKMLTGGIFKATDGVQNKYVTITPEGEIIELKKEPPSADAVIDISPLIKYSTETSKTVESNKTVETAKSTVQPKSVKPSLEANATDLVKEAPKGVADAAVAEPVKDTKIEPTVATDAADAADNDDAINNVIKDWKTTSAQDLANNLITVTGSREAALEKVDAGIKNNELHLKDATTKDFTNAVASGLPAIQRLDKLKAVMKLLNTPSDEPEVPTAEEKQARHDHYSEQLAVPTLTGIDLKRLSKNIEVTDTDGKESVTHAVKAKDRYEYIKKQGETIKKLLNCLHK